MPSRAAVNGRRGPAMSPCVPHSLNTPHTKLFASRGTYPSPHYIFGRRFGLFSPFAGLDVPTGRHNTRWCPDHFRHMATFPPLHRNPVVFASRHGLVYTTIGHVIGRRRRGPSSLVLAQTVVQRLYLPLRGVPSDNSHTVSLHNGSV